MLPHAGLIIPLYVVLAKYHLTNTLTGVILTYMTFVLPFAVWTLRGFILGIPKELEEAAMVDGSSRLGAFVRILLPLVAPGLVATSVFAFITTWNEYIFASVLLSDQSNQTITVWLSYFYGDQPEHGLGRADGRVDADRDPGDRVLPARAAEDHVRAHGRRRAWMSDRAPAFQPLIPRPLAVAPERGSFELGPRARIVVAATSPRPPTSGASSLGSCGPPRGYALPVVRAPRAAAAGDLVLSLAPGDRSLGKEGYRLYVDEERALRSSPAARPGSSGGRRRSGSSCRRGSSPVSPLPGRGSLPRGTIHDRPRFAWRGLMLDVARHFFGVEEVERLVDEMTLYKLNRLHLHLTDDQGWRVAIRSWPNLTRLGARSAVGGGSGGHLTQRQYARIVAYARRRFVDVVPEIDMPGHVNAVLASYGRLTADDVAPAPYTGIEVGFSSLAIRKELTYAFIDDVVREVAALTPGPYLHIGGDEALSTDPADYRFFVERVQRIVRAHGKRMVGWEETARARLRRTSVAQHWHDAALARTRRRAGREARALARDADVPRHEVHARPPRSGLSWAGTTDVRQAYDWDPATLLDGVSDRDLLGIEAALWSETIDDRAGLDHLAFPRLLGHAELGWSPAEGRAWRDYRLRLAAHGARLAARGVGFHAAPEIPWAS